MMYTKLYHYLIQHKQLAVPGIGTFLLERKPALIDFPNRQITPPVYSFSLRSPGTTVSRSFFSWLGEALNITERDAVLRFNDFAYDLKRQIGNGDVIDWNGVGVLSKGPSGEIKLTPSAKASVHEKPVTAEKVIRENPKHMVRVGEDEKTSAEMLEMLNQPAKKRSYWWVYAAGLGLLSTMFIGWYFSEHGLNVPATANTQHVAPQETTVTYQIAL